MHSSIYCRLKKTFTRSSDDSDWFIQWEIVKIQHKSVQKLQIHLRFVYTSMTFLKHFDKVIFKSTSNFFQVRVKNFAFNYGNEFSQGGHQPQKA